MKSGILGELIAMAADSIKSHKLRSFLTLLGIMIGVMTVIGMVSIIQGLNKSFLAELQSVGSDMIHVQKYEAVQMGQRSEEERLRKDLTFDDAKAIEKDAPLVRAVAVNIYVSPFETAEVKYGNAKSDTARNGRPPCRSTCPGWDGSSPRPRSSARPASASSARSWPTSSSR
jgi:putative ABC transport system permease protein